MMATFFGTTINPSPTMVLQAGENMENAQGIALAIKDGKAVKPEAGVNVIGISLITNDEVIEMGADITIQIKDMGKWVAGEKLCAGEIGRAHV